MVRRIPASQSILSPVLWYESTGTKGVFDKKSRGRRLVLTLPRLHSGGKAKVAGFPALAAAAGLPVTWSQSTPGSPGRGQFGSGSQSAYRGEQGYAIPKAPVCRFFIRASGINKVTSPHLRGGWKRAKMFASDRPGSQDAHMSHRRTSKRIPVELPVEIRWKNRSGSLRHAMGKTGNISGSGLFIEVAARLHRATSVMIKVKLPKEVTKVPLELLCQGRVVRWNQVGAVQGLGAVIDEYELRPVKSAASADRPASKATS